MNTKEQLEGRIAFYQAKIKDGIGLTDEDITNYQHIRRELYHLKHRERKQIQRISFQSIRRCLDDGVI